MQLVSLLMESAVQHQVQFYVENARPNPDYV